MREEDILLAHLHTEFPLDDADTEVNEETDLIAHSIVDSLGIFRVIAFVEERFGLQILPDEVTLENFQTIAKISTLIRQKQALLST